MGWLNRNVQMHVWPLEHCLSPIGRWDYGPHVTAVCGPEGWIARIAFSMHYDHVYLYDVVAHGRPPKKQVLINLLNDVHQRRFDCRAEWWKNMRSVCLDNAAAVKLMNGVVDIVDAASPQQGVQGRIVSGSGVYRARKEVAIDVIWQGQKTPSGEVLSER
jgi:hypothetical protein